MCPTFKIHHFIHLQKSKVNLQYIDQQIHQQMIQLKVYKCEGLFGKFYLKAIPPLPQLKHHSSIPLIFPFICSIQSNIEYTTNLIK